ncbi:MAG: hypothetical protein FWG67_08590 [Defluviitaleaceae bacterium]|nr:hypothetical protein [Defluviitaleaceae bacterium]
MKNRSKYLLVSCLSCVFLLSGNILAVQASPLISPTMLNAGPDGFTAQIAIVGHNNSLPIYRLARGTRILNGANNITVRARLYRNGREAISSHLATGNTSVTVQTPTYTEHTNGTFTASARAN